MDKDIEAVQNFIWTAANGPVRHFGDHTGRTPQYGDEEIARAQAALSRLAARLAPVDVAELVEAASEAYIGADIWAELPEDFAAQKAYQDANPDHHFITNREDERKQIRASLEAVVSPIFRELTEARARVEVLEGALRGMLRLTREAQDILTEYLIPDGTDADSAIDALLQLLDGPKQREIEGAARAALAGTEGGE